MTGGARKVFGTVELFENILVTTLLQGMTQIELMMVQNVSKTWKATIEGSPLLQKAMFRRAATTKEDADSFSHWSAAVPDITQCRRGHRSSRSDRHARGPRPNTTQVSIPSVHPSAIIEPSSFASNDPGSTYYLPLNENLFLNCLHDSSGKLYLDFPGYCDFNQQKHSSDDGALFLHM